MSESIVHAFQIDGNGGGVLLERGNVSDAIKADTLAWVHLNATHADARAWLRREISYLDPVIVSALLASETRPRVIEMDKGIMLNLRGVNLNENAEPEDMVSTRMWIDSHRIISVEVRKLRAIEEICNKLTKGKGPKNSGQFLTMLVGGLFDKMESTFGELDEKLDDMEAHILDRSALGDRQAVNTIRRQSIVFRRHVAPQKDAIAALKICEAEWLSTLHRRKLQESHDQLIRYVEDLDSIRERGQIIKEEIASMIADKMNNNMYVLSVIAAVFLPLGFLTGLMGINIGGMPGVDNNAAFWIFSVFLAVVVALQVLLFKWKKWF